MAMKLKKNAAGELFITFECPHCQAGLKNRAEQIGSMQRCTDCGGRFTVPGDEIYRAYLEGQGGGQPPQREAPPARPQPIQIDPEPVSRPRQAEPRRPEPVEARPRRSRYQDDLDFDAPYSGSSTSAPGFADDYISMTLRTGEKAVLQFGPATAAVLTLQVMTGLMFLIYVLFIAGIVFTGRNDFANRPGTAFGGTFIAMIYLFCLLVLPWLIALLRVMRRRYTITNMRTVSRHGLASLNVTEVRNTAISGLGISQHLFGRWFGFGTVHIYSDGLHLRLSSVDQPVAVAAALQGVMRGQVD
jgi:hypothetical protein